MPIIKRFFKKPGMSFFLFGPRGTGKSTWVEQNIDQAIFIDLLSQKSYNEYSSNPDLLAQTVEENPQFKIFIIDEVQKAPAILNVVHMLIEKYKNHTFILTGSNPKKLKKAGVNLMAGRALYKQMFPFMASELGLSFNLEEALQIGMIPMIFGSTNAEEQLDSYVHLYLQEEVESDRSIKDMGTFNSFLKLISFSHGQILNMNNIARESNTPRQTIENYIKILESMMMSYRIPAFVSRPKRQLMTKSKFYLFDTGIYNILRPQRSSANLAGDLIGPALEGLVLQHLKAWSTYSSDRYLDVYFWRTKNGLEVDFIVEGKNDFHAIEVKNSRVVHSRDLKGLKEFKKDYPESKPILLYRGDHKIKVDGISCMPVDQFLLNLKPNEWPI